MGRRNSIVCVLGTAGIVGVAVLVGRVGPWRILSQVTALWSVLPLTLLVTAGKYPLQAAGWRLALSPADRPPWWRSVGATLSGDAVGYLTFAGPVTGEPARALLLREYLPIPVGIAVGVFERAVYATTGTILVLVAFTIAAVRLGRTVPAVAVPIALLLLLVAGAALAHRRTRAAVRPRSHQPWRAVLRDLWVSRRKSIALIVAFGLLEHALLAVEAGIILHALGTQPTVSLVLVFEGLAKALNSIGSIVPGRLGVNEAGSTLIAAGLGVGASVGLMLSLMRRARALLWSAAGVALLFVHGLAPRQLSAAAAAWGDDMPSRDGISSRGVATPPPASGAR